MADRTETLELLLKARNLTDAATKTAAAGLNSVVDSAGRVKGAMQGLGSATAVGLGMAAETLASGGGIGAAAAQLGLHMVSELTETFGGQLIEKLTSSSLIALITAPLAGLGTAIGGLISAAIPIGMALLPFILIAAIVAAVVFLVNNPEIVGKIAEFVGSVIGAIMRFLGELPGKIVDLYVGIWKLVLGTAGDFIRALVDFLLKLPGRLGELGGMIVRTIIDGLVSLPGKIADVIRDAFQSLKIDVGPFHISAKGVTIDLPKFTAEQSANYHLTGQVPGSARGGWVGMHGPEVRVVGEEGPEYVVPNDRLGGLGGGTVNLTLNVAGETIARVLLPLVSRELYYELAAEAPSSSRA